MVRYVNQGVAIRTERPRDIQKRFSRKRKRRVKKNFILNFRFISVQEITICPTVPPVFTYPVEASPGILSDEFERREYYKNDNPSRVSKIYIYTYISPRTCTKLKFTNCIRLFDLEKFTFKLTFINTGKRTLNSIESENRKATSMFHRYWFANITNLSRMGNLIIPL